MTKKNEPRFLEPLGEGGMKALAQEHARRLEAEKATEELTSELNGTIKDRDKLIASKQAELDALDAQCAEHEARITAQEQEIHALQLVRTNQIGAGPEQFAFAELLTTIPDDQREPFAQLIQKHGLSVSDASLVASVPAGDSRNIMLTRIAERAGGEEQSALTGGRELYEQTRAGKNTGIQFD